MYLRTVFVYSFETLIIRSKIFLTGFNSGDGYKKSWKVPWLLVKALVIILWCFCTNGEEHFQLVSLVWSPGQEEEVFLKASVNKMFSLWRIILSYS